MKCKFKHDDGSWNIVEGSATSGRVQCTACGRIYPRQSSNPIPLPQHTDKLSMAKCPGSPAALAARGEKKPCGACIESTLNRAAKAYQTMIDMFAKVLVKANPDLQAAVMDELNKMVEPDIARLQGLAVKQALKEGQEYDAAINPGNQVASGEAGHGEGVGDAEPPTTPATPAAAVEPAPV
jgi:hypothetical protein